MEAVCRLCQRKLLQLNQKPGDAIIGKSSLIKELIEMADRIAPTGATVLIQGESGTGKELIAKRLHQMSGRAGTPFVTLNCGALQETLLESELFGHEKGSFTGAVNQKIGLVQTAQGGTLFLDEVGELTPGIQAKLLRFLQEGEFYRVGGKDPHRVDVRIVSATNRDLDSEVKAGRFREDLFYRLNTISLVVPPLRGRRDDIPELIEYFLNTPRHQHHGGGTELHRSVDPKAMDILKRYNWPGNIRELQNTVERMRILSDGPVIKEKDLPETVVRPGLPRADVGSWTAGTPLEDVERDHILRTLSHFEGNKSRAAKNLKITIKTLYNKLHRYGVMEKSDEKREESYAQPETL
jgi:two-component system response regulator HydG